MAITKVYLLSVPLEKDYAHTLYFANQAAQLSYFQGRIQKRYEDFTYQRKDGVIRVPDQIDTLWKLGANYVMYQNPDYNDKWFYAFITNMQYINDGRTDITIQTDCLQTWMFEKVMKPCFVEREHTANDAIGENTVPEDLETGDFSVNSMYSPLYGSEMAIIIGVTRDPESMLICGGGKYSGLYSGVKYYAFSESDTVAIENFIAKYGEGHADSIVVMFMAPRYLAEGGNDTMTPGAPVPATGVDLGYAINSTDPGIVYASKTEHKFSEGKLDGYTPVNKKLLCHPYRYLLTTNNAGASAVYKYERFYKKDENGAKTIIEPAFVIKGVLTPGCSVRMFPDCYNGASNAFNYDEGLTMGKFPILNWTSDAYTNWLTQNSVNMGIQVVSGVAQIAAGVAIAAGTGGLGAGIGGGTVLGGVSTIAGVLSQRHQMSFAPPQVEGNLNSGDVTTAIHKNTFIFYDMSIKAEYARIIDEYFSMYGYKTHRVKIPEQNHRANYWFTKTIDANITGAIPQADLQTIKDCYNRGVTYWKTPANFKDYTVANGTV